MIKKVIIIIVFILLVTPVTIQAKTNSVNDIMLIADIDGCSDNSNSIFGDINSPNSTAWLIQKLLNYIKVLGPTIAIALGSLDMGKAIITSDEENMKKAQSRFIKRILAAVALFFVPLLTGILLKMVGVVTDDPTCGLK